MADAPQDQAGSPQGGTGLDQPGEPPLERLVGTSTEAEESEVEQGRTEEGEAHEAGAGSPTAGDVQENPESQVGG